MIIFFITNHDTVQGLGYAMVPLLADYVLYHYGWKDVCALFSFFCFLSTIFGFFLEPPRCCYNYFECKLSDVTAKEEKINSSIEDGEEMKSLVSAGVEPSIVIIKEEGKVVDLETIGNKKILNVNVDTTGNVTPVMCNGKYLRKNKSESCLYVLEQCVPPYKRLKKIIEHDIEDHGEFKNLNFSVVSCMDILLNIDMKEGMVMKRQETLEKIRLSVVSKEMVSHNELDKIHLEDNIVDKNNFHVEKSIIETERLYMNNDSILSDEVKKDAFITNPPGRFKSKLSELFKLSLFKSTSFVVFCISNVMLFMALNIPFAYGPDMMVQRKIVSEDKGSNFNMAIGFTSMISMPLVGLLVDNGPKLNPFLVTVFSMISAGVSMFVFTLTWSLIESLVVAVWFGISFSAFLSLPPVILEIILGKDNVPSAYGLLVFIRGISISVGPPLAGCIYDLTKNYNGSFYFAGVLFAMAGLPIIAVYFYHERRNPLRS